MVRSDESAVEKLTEKNNVPLDYGAARFFYISLCWTSAQFDYSEQKEE